MIILHKDNIEIFGTSSLSKLLSGSNKVRPSINDTDKKITWDGDIIVYKTRKKQQTKDDLLFEIPIQVKAHVDANNPDSCVHDIEITDLKNYSTKGGTIFFKIIGDPNGENERYYYKGFLPGDIDDLLRKAKGKKTIRISLDSFPTDIGSLESLLTAFAEAMREGNADNSMRRSWSKIGSSRGWDVSKTPSNWFLTNHKAYVILLLAFLLVIVVSMKLIAFTKEHEKQEIENASSAVSENDQTIASETVKNPVTVDFEWKSLNNATVELGIENHERFEQYLAYTSSDTENDIAEYAVLLARFENQTDKDITIKDCRIYLDEIKEIRSPQYVLFCRPPSNANSIDPENYCTLSLYNSGWGKTEDVSITLKEIMVDEMGREPFYLLPEEFLDQKAAIQCSFEPIAPGSSSTVKLYSRDMMKYINSPEAAIGYYYFTFELNSASGLHQEIESVYFWEVHEPWTDELPWSDEAPFSIDYLTEWDLGHGGEVPVKIACVINTADPEYDHTYTTYKRIPAGGFLTLALCIAPTKSCSLSASVSFHISDGKNVDTIITTPNEIMRIIVPCYPYIRRDVMDGDSDRWKVLDEGDFYVFYPH